jgi:hypothetical protein
MRSIPAIGNGDARVVNIVFVFYVPKEKTREVLRRERERKVVKR